MLVGLAYVHEQGVVHLNIKPSKLLVSRDGLVKLTGFGLAKIGVQNDTQTGLLAGTAQFMAPEQYMGGTLDHRCDIHAAGAVLYELLAGVPAFRGGTGDIMYNVCYGAPSRVSQESPAIPKAFDSVVAKALAKNPEDRYESAAQFNEVLQTTWQTIAGKAAHSILSAQAGKVATAIRAAGAGDPPSSPPLMAAVPKTYSGRERYELLARDLCASDQRNRFLAGESQPPDTGIVAPPPSDSNDKAAPLSTVPPSLITPEVLQRATQLLARYVGPVATVVAKRIAPAASDEAHLYALLADTLQDPVERASFCYIAARFGNAG